MAAQRDNIKVVIRFKGAEDVEDGEQGQTLKNGNRSWTVDEDRGEVMPPATEKNKAAELFTFDDVLVANSQERMYRHAAKETVT